MKFAPIISKLKLKYAKFKDYLKKSIDLDDRAVLKEFFFSVLFYGLTLNFIALILFNFKFNWYSWVAFGFLYWITEKKIVRWIGGIIHKR
jgi:hypothetical protein